MDAEFENVNFDTEKLEFVWSAWTISDTWARWVDSLEPKDTRLRESTTEAIIEDTSQM